MKIISATYPELTAEISISHSPAMPSLDVFLNEQIKLGVFYVDARGRVRFEPNSHVVQFVDEDGALTYMDLQNKVALSPADHKTEAEIIRELEEKLVSVSNELHIALQIMSEEDLEEFNQAINPEDEEDES